MARRGRVEAWSLVGLFGLVALASALTASRIPTRLVLDRTGMTVAVWPLRAHRAWRDISELSFQESAAGTWMRFRDRHRPRVLTLGARWPGLLVPSAAAGHDRRLQMQVEAWRVAAPH
jgi:hypothetical protein